MADPVAILGGTGQLGFGLALRLGLAGHSVVIGSRDAAKADEAAKRASELVPSATFTGAGNEEAAAAAGKFVVLSVPFSNQASTIRSISESLTEGKLVIDATVPLGPAIGGKPTQIIGVWQGSAAQQAQDLVPKGVKVVSALHTVSASLLEDLQTPLDQDVLIAGNFKADKAEVTELLGSVEGLNVVDCGRLDQSRILESMTALLIGLNIRNKTHAGIKITGLK